MISFILPAHDEEAWIGRSVAAVGAAAAGLPYEVIVVDDASADATAGIARAAGARVLRVEHRHIAATRNAGARAALGEALFFVDADTLVNAAIVREALASIAAGAVGGGCVARFEGRLPLWFKIASPVTEATVRVSRYTGGCCLFCTRAAFEAVGGFDEAQFAAEDLVFIRALRRRGRFVILREPVVTSGRNLRAYSFWKIAGMLARLALRGPAGIRDRERLDWWYRPKREKVAKPSGREEV